MIVGLVASGCLHTVRIESSPGAEILIDDKLVGRSPVTWEEASGADPVRITARHQGKERSVVVERSEVDPANIAAGAAAGFGACVGLTCFNAFASSLTGGALAIPLAGVQCVACLLPFAGSGGFFYFIGHHLPDVVKIPMNGAALKKDAEEAPKRPLPPPPPLLDPLPELPSDPAPEATPWSRLPDDDEDRATAPPPPPPPPPPLGQKF